MSFLDKIRDLAIDSKTQKEENRKEQQRLSNKRNNRLYTYVFKELIRWRDDNGGHTREGSTRLTDYINEIRWQGEKHPTIKKEAAKMKISVSEYYSIWDHAATVALQFKKVPTSKISYVYSEDGVQVKVKSNGLF